MLIDYEIIYDKTSKNECFVWAIYATMLSGTKKQRNLAFREYFYNHHDSISPRDAADILVQTEEIVRFLLKDSDYQNLFPVDRAEKEKRDADEEATRLNLEDRLNGQFNGLKEKIENQRIMLEIHRKKGENALAKKDKKRIRELNKNLADVEFKLEHLDD